MHSLLPRDPNHDTEATESSKQQKKKRWHSKVRTGCDRCKSRRVKCDEKRPSCQRCVKAGFVCPGYANVPQPRIFEPDGGPLFDSELEKKSFDYLTREGMQILTTFQPSSRAFYLKAAPQISTNFPALKHVMVAIGAIQAPLHYSKPGQLLTVRKPQVPAFPLQELTKSMHLLAAADPAKVPFEGLVACCIFFMAFTIWTEKVGAPVVHIEAGLKLIEDHINSARQGVVPLNELAVTEMLPMFQRLTINCCTFTDDYPSATSIRPQNYQLDMDLEKAGQFINIDDAFESIMTIQKLVLRLREGQTIDGIRARTAVALDEFEEALNVLYIERIKDLKAMSVTGNKADHDHQHLRMSHRVISVLFHTIDAVDEMAYDRHRSDFLFILSECKKFLFDDAEISQRSSSALKTTLGIIPPLFMVATKCRDTQIRRQAIELLHSTARVERGWTSCIATGLAKFVANQEEMMSPGIASLDQVPARIRLEEVEHNSWSRITNVKYWECYPGLQPVLKTASIPYNPHPSMEVDGQTPKMSRKVLHAFGYTGIVLYCPHIACHCAPGLESSPHDTE